MKYSIRGQIKVANGDAIIAVINDYQLWRLVSDSIIDETEASLFVFEAWVNTDADKTRLFDDLKPFVDANSGSYINWHLCSHDEQVTKPCEIIEEHRG